MSTQIDPLTGLPMVFDNIIEQIPLDAQIFPYADLGATARPTAPPLYPDSIIPVSAFLSGQHPDTGSAQTVATNGDHDLRVHVTNPASGGGASPIPVGAFGGGNAYADTLVAGSYSISNAFHFAKSIYGFLLGFMYMVTPPADVSPLHIYIENQDNLDDIDIFYGFPRHYNGTTWEGVTLNVACFYPMPIDLTPSTGGNLTQFELDYRTDAEFTMALRIFGV